jgi:hypothetical protein
MMKGLLVVATVIVLEALSLSQPAKPATTHPRPVGDPHCSRLKFQSTSALPSYDGRGFSTVEDSSPDEPFIVPSGCFQFSCEQKRGTYRVLSCPNLKVKAFSRTMDSTGSQASASTENSVPASSN